MAPNLAVYIARGLTSTKRIFGIDIETCEHCGDVVKVASLTRPCARGISVPMHVIACIEDPAVIKKNLMHLDEKPTRLTLLYSLKTEFNPTILFQHSRQKVENDRFSFLTMLLFSSGYGERYPYFSGSVILVRLKSVRSA